LFLRISRFITEDGVEIQKDIVKDAVHSFNKVADDVYKILPNERIRHGRIVTVAPLIHERLAKEIERNKGELSCTKDTKRAWNAMLNFVRYYDGDELEQVTWEKYRDEYNLPEGGDVYIPGGYDQILKHLMKSIPKKSLMLQKEVIEILWNNRDDKSIKIKTRDESTFEADHVIVTSSIGYLKRHHETCSNRNFLNQKLMY
jgi:hypothetical protein